MQPNKDMYFFQQTTETYHFPGKKFASLFLLGCNRRFGVRRVLRNAGDISKTKGVPIKTCFQSFPLHFCKQTLLLFLKIRFHLFLTTKGCLKFQLGLGKSGHAFRTRISGERRGRERQRHKHNHSPFVAFCTRKQLSLTHTTLTHRAHTLTETHKHSNTTHTHLTHTTSSHMHTPHTQRHHIHTHTHHTHTHAHHSHLTHTTLTIHHTPHTHPHTQHTHSPTLAPTHYTPHTHKHTHTHTHTHTHVHPQALCKHLISQMTELYIPFVLITSKPVARRS